MAQKDFWTKVLTRLKPTIKWANFLTWFQNTTVMSVAEGELVVGVPTSFAQNWISSKYETKLLQAAREIDPTIKSVTYEVHSRLSDKDNIEGVDLKGLFTEEGPKKVRKVRNTPEFTISKISKNGASVSVQSQMMNSRYSLDSFVVGLDNRLPHAAASAVVSMPGGIYNPLYIYGQTGLGKTHLLQAIGNGILNHYPDMVVKYITAEKFVTEVVQAIGNRHMKRFKEQYRNVDCFLIDDVQFFARKDSSQQEFFHTFNELYQQNKQIVLTSDRSPSELDDLDERLKSRFGMGMVVELLVPDFETRLAILNAKCQEFAVLIDPEVLSFVAQNVDSSVRELEGVLRQIVAEVQLTDRVATIPMVAEILKRMNKAKEIIGYDVNKKRDQFVARTASDVMKKVAQYYDISLDELKGSSRKKDISTARQICMYLIRTELDESYEKIGIGFGGRNHTTVMHACSRTTQKLKKDVRLIKDLNAIKDEIGF